MYKACIFDLDGTLADTIGSISHFANETIKKFGLAPFRPHDYQYFAGDGADDLIHRVLAASGCDTEEMFSKVFPLYRKSYLQDPLFGARPYDGILPLLDNLASAGAAMAVVSNKSDDTAQKVVAGLFGGRFPVVIGRREGFPKKPNPASALEAARLLGVEAGRCLYIGDTKVDMQTGQNAGMDTVGVLWGFRTRDELLAHKAAYIVSSPEEILPIFTGVCRT